MNAVKHSEISVKRRGGIIEDYYEIHSFIDCTKNLCSDNRHRILHTMWGINTIIVPIFGHTIVNSSGKKINVKDLCEEDHILPDYANKFIPTIADFIDALDLTEFDLSNWESKIETINSIFSEDKKIQELLLSPLAHTGKLVSLLLTHNSWFINFIIPKIFNKSFIIKDFEISPSIFFNNMKFELWMDNGSDYPKSAKKIEQLNNKVNE
jgi:hypothetical protein